MPEDWNALIANCRTQGNGGDGGLKQKDIIILRLYLTFMGLDLADE